MRIGFDLDGVLYPWHESAYQYCLRVGDTDKNFKEFWKEDVWRFNKLWQDNLCGVLTLYSDRSPESGVMDMLDRLSIDNELFYITSRPDDALTVTINYLIRYDFPFKENLIFSHNKVIPVVQNELDYLVEDNPYNIQSLKNFTNVIAVLRPYSEDYELGVKTVNSVIETESMFNGQA